MSFDYEKLKHILACPKCRSELVHDGEALVCVNPDSRYSYPVVDDIPRLLEEEGRELDHDAWGEIMKRHGRDPATGQPAE